LTPYDDDVLLAGLVTLRAAGSPHGARLADLVAVADLEAATTATSAALLRYAADGWCLDELAAYLTARARGDADRCARSADALARVGHSSGRGMLAGVRRVIGPGPQVTRRPRPMVAA
jgi:hypothetical protein